MPRPRTTQSLLAVALLLATSPACADDPDLPAVGTDGPPGASRVDSLRLERVADGLDFPTFLTAPPGAADRLFVTEKSGVVRVIRDGRLLPESFLDLRDRVSTSGERGLLSLAFHPEYARNGRFFVYLTDPEGAVRIVEYRVSSADPDRADPASARTVLTIPQPYANHNGGLAAFGPDGNLYLGLGDGGSGGDPQENGQNPGTLLGAMLRIGVDGEAPYTIPPDNPFVDTPGARPEVWAYGVRNPWRFAFDRETDDLYIADVGQNRWEEVNALPLSRAEGANYGWDRMEATHCFEPEEGCDRSGLTLPVLEYGREDGCAVTGGYVYRGTRIPWLRGTYLYSDFCEGWIRSFRLRGGEATERRDWTDQLGELGNVVSFGEDAVGELYVLTQDGSVFRIAPRSP